MEKLTKSYVKSAVNIPKPSEVFNSNPETVLDCFCYFSRKHPNKDAVIFRSTTEPRFAITWQELYERICQMAKAYIAMGIKPGEVIAVCTRACPEWLYAVFGAMAAGITVTTIVFTYADGSDLVSMMERLKTCSLLILDPGLNDSNWAICKTLVDNLDPEGHVSSTRLPYLRHLVFINPPPGDIAVKTMSDILNGRFEVDLPTVNPDSPAVLFQTSGSTGVPKLAAHTQNNLLNSGRSFDLSTVGVGTAEYNDRPFGWAGGFPFGLIIGQTRVTVSDMCPPPDDKLSFMVEVITSEGCTSIGMLPPMIYDLTKRYKELPDNWPIQTLLTGGQPITSAITVCLGRLCRSLCLGYGGTEFMAVSMLEVTEPEQFVDYSCGQPKFGVEVKIVDEAGEAVPIGERGEIYTRSDWIFHSYFNDPEKTSQVKIADGWYKTDDYGWMNADGYMFVEGRISDLIISGGMNVTPAILEAVLKSHPGVESAIIVPVPDVEKYQVICACVVTKDGYDLAETELFEYMERKHNDEQKLFAVLPKFYLILSEFPIGSTGKVARKTLRQMAEKRFSSK